MDGDQSFLVAIRKGFSYFLESSCRFNHHLKNSDDKMRLKIFGCHRDGWLNIFGHPKGGTNYGDQKFLVSIRGRPKKFNHVTLGNQKISVAPLWWLKIVSHHKDVQL
jgi:hypothetical protein